MDISIFLFLATIVIYVPMAGVLLYVWHKFGKGDTGVQKARIAYVLGSLAVLITMIFM